MWTVQNEMRSVLGWMTRGAALRIPNSSNFTEMRLTEAHVYCSEHEKGHNERDKNHKFLNGHKGDLCVEKFK